MIDNNKYLARQGEIDRIYKIFETTNNKVLNINGAWGTGKSYLSKGLETKLLEQGYDVLRINVSDYEYSSDPLIPFLITLLNYTNGLPISKDKTSLQENIIKGLRIVSVITSLIGAENVSNALSQGIELIKGEDNTLTTLESNLSNFKDYQNKLTKFKGNIQELCKITQAPKVIIFIDDFDRTSPEFSFKVLNMVHQLKKLYDDVSANEQILQFCTIMNRRQFETQLKSIYGGLDTSRDEHYLTKYIDLEHTTIISEEIVSSIYKQFRGRDLASPTLLKLFKDLLTARELIQYIGILKPEDTNNYTKLILILIYIKYKLELDSAWFGLSSSEEIITLSKKICNLCDTIDFSALQIYTPFKSIFINIRFTKSSTSKIHKDWYDDVKYAKDIPQDEHSAMGMYVGLLEMVHSQ